MNRKNIIESLLNLPDILCFSIIKYDFHIEGIVDIVFDAKYANNGLIELPNNRIAAGNKNIKIWNLKTKQEELLESDLMDKNENIISLGYIYVKDILRLVSYSFGRCIRIWNIETRKVIFTITRKSGINCFCVINNSRIMIGLKDGNIEIWDIKCRKPIKKLKGHLSSVMYIKKTIFDNKVISDSYDEVRVWDINEEKCILVINTGISAFCGSFNAIPYLCDNLLAYRANNKITIIDILTGEIKRQIDYAAMFIKHKNGKLFLCCMEELSMWDIETGKCEAVRKYGDIIIAIDILPNNGIILKLHNNILVEDQVFPHKASGNELFLLSDGRFITFNYNQGILINK